MKKNKKRILHVIPDLAMSGGIQHYVLNICKYIDKSIYHCDVLHHNWRQKTKTDSADIKKAFIKTGANVYSVTDPSRHLIKFFKETRQVFSSFNQYDVIHVHSMGTSARFLWLAKKYKIKNRIFHVHETELSEKILNRCRNYFLLKISGHYATKFIAVTKLAGKKILKNKDFDVVYPGIEADKFLYNENYRMDIRIKENINDKTFVIGCVGRLTKQKNYFYMIDLFKKITKIKQDSILLFIGSGPLEKKLKLYSRQRGIASNIKFLGNRNNMNEYYSAIDALVMPSNYEGLPIVAIEAQISGLPVFLSNNITSEASILKCEYFSLKEDKVIIARNIIDSSNVKNRNIEPLKIKRFTNNNLKIKIQDIYESL